MHQQGVKQQSVPGFELHVHPIVKINLIANTIEAEIDVFPIGIAMLEETLLMRSGEHG